MATIGIMLVKPTVGQILSRAAAEQNWFKGQMSELGHETHTMLWSDFTIADYYGTKAITDTYNKVLDASKSYDAEKKKNKYNEKVVTEMYMVLNWKLNTFHGKNDILAQHYYELYEKLYEFVTKHFTKEQLSYFYETTD